MPASHRDLLRFELKRHEREYGSFSAVVPSGWSYDSDTHTYSPPKEQLPPLSKTIGFSSLRIWTTCAGTCEPKDWAVVIEQKVQEIRDKGYLIERDETPAAGQRLIVSKHADKHIIAHFFHRTDGSRYFLCEAEVDRLAAPALPAFEAACRGLVTQDWR